MTAAAKTHEQVLPLASDLDLPLDAITERLGFMGQSGSGKTYAAMRLAELMLEVGAQIIAVDPVGPWWGLRAAADGNGPGFPVHVFGGIHGDVPLTPEAGNLVADVLVDKGISAVLDISDFTIGQMHGFMVDFAERFFERKKRAPTPVHIFWEECHTFIPNQLPPDPKAALMLNRVDRIIRVGRNYGVGSSLISQMPQSVATKSRNQIACLFAMRTLGPHERAAINAWFGDKAQSAKDLKLGDLLEKLQTGWAYAASPVWLGISPTKVHLTRKTTFDSSATPKFGVKLEPPKVLAPIDVAALRNAMAAVVDEAEKDDPKALRKRVADLEKQLAAKPKPQAQVEKVVVKEVPVLKESELKRLERVAEKLSAASKDVAAATASVTDAVRQAQSTEGKYVAPPLGLSPKMREQIFSAPSPIKRELERLAQPPPATIHNADEGEPLTDYAVGLLETMRRRAPMELTRTQVAILSGRSTGSSSFEGAMAKLIKTGHIEKRGSGYRLTELGASRTEHVAGAGDRDVVETWRFALPGYERKVFEALLERPSMTREELGARINRSTSSSTFEGAISTLKKNGLVTVGGGRVTLAEELVRR